MIIKHNRKFNCKEGFDVRATGARNLYELRSEICMNYVPEICMNPVRLRNKIFQKRSTNGDQIINHMKQNY